MHVVVEVLSMRFFFRKQKPSKFSSQLMLTQGSPSSPQVQFLTPSSKVGFGRTASRSSATQYGWSNLANGGNIIDVFLRFGFECLFFLYWTVVTAFFVGCCRKNLYMFEVLFSFVWESMATPFCVISSFKNFIVKRIQLLTWHVVLQVWSPPH